MSTSSSIAQVRFSLSDAQQAADTWGANCGPGALAAVMGMTLEEVRPHLVDFERKRYTNPLLMYAALRSLGARWKNNRNGAWPAHGLVRVQWEGRWTEPGVPMKARYRQTHWVGSRRLSTEAAVDIFDINCICVGGWVPFTEWRDHVVPWLLRECVPGANGKWHITHALEVKR